MFSGQRELTAALKEFPDGSRLEFGRGSFDDWCVFVTHPPGPRHAPRDVDYFAELKTLHGRFPQLHEHFIEVFQRTSRVVDAATLERITEHAALYPSEVRVSVDVLLTTLQGRCVHNATGTLEYFDEVLVQLGKATVQGF